MVAEAGPLGGGGGVRGVGGVRLFFPPRNVPPRDSPTHRQTRGYMLTVSLFFPDLTKQHWKIFKILLEPKDTAAAHTPKGHCNQSTLPFQRLRKACLRQAGLPAFCRYGVMYSSSTHHRLHQTLCYYSQIKVAFLNTVNCPG